MIGDVYGFIFKIIFICQYPQLRKHFINDLCFIFRKTYKQVGPDSTVPAYAMDPKAVGELYFTQLNNDWCLKQKK